jgi:hypothetical protein
MKEIRLGRKGKTRVTTLDCETLDTTYDSLVAILEKPREDLEEWICNLDPETLAGGEWAVWDALEDGKQISISPSWNTTVFFHFSRTVDPASFKNTGLLPLTPRLLDLIWTQLRGYEAASPPEHVS